jgi:hypothetical protein
MEDTALPLFDNDTFQHTSQRWRAIQFDEGPLGFGMLCFFSSIFIFSSILSFLPLSLVNIFTRVIESTGIVNSVALPLAKAEINIYYVSTYNSGLTLV